MRVGSIVQCVRAGMVAVEITDEATANIIPKVGDVFIVIHIFHDWAVFLTLDGMPKENQYDASFFREIEFPPSLEIEIKELLTIKEPARELEKTENDIQWYIENLPKK
jgi:hypothetical protein